MLVRVEAPHFVAGLVIGGDERCVRAAPILKWALHKRADELREFFRKKGWKATRVGAEQNSANGSAQA